MTLDPVTGLFVEIPYHPSPNYDVYPDPLDISLLVIHNISLPPGQFEGNDVLDLFTNRLDTSKHPFYAGLEGLRVSAHVFIRRDGQAIQCVPCNLRAWHAGESIFQRRPRCNDFSIGIELEGTDESGYTDAQYETLVELTLALQHVYPKITRERIVGHCDVAPGRKTDPGAGFAWQKYFDLLDVHYQSKEVV